MSQTRTQTHSEFILSIYLEIPSGVNGRSPKHPLPLQVSCTSVAFLKRLEQWPEEGWLFLHKIGSRKNTKGVSKMDNRLVWIAWKIFFLWFKSSSKFGKEDGETGPFEVWHGCKHRNVFDYISHVSLFLYLCFYCIFCHTFVCHDFNSLQSSFLQYLKALATVQPVSLPSVLSFKWAKNQYFLTLLAVVLC